MAKLKITGIDGYDGEYDLDVSYFTNRELHTIKELSGVRAGELKDAFKNGDNDLLVALAVVAVQRAGKTVTRDADPFWDAPAGSSLEYDFDDEDTDAGPPASAPQSESEEPGSSGETRSSSGNDSKPAGDHPVSVPSPIGELG